MADGQFTVLPIDNRPLADKAAVSSMSISADSFIIETGGDIRKILKQNTGLIASYVGPTAPTSALKTGDMWIDTATAPVNLLKRYNGSSWDSYTMQAALAINTVDNTILSNMTANSIKANATGGSADPQDVAISANQFLARASTGNLAVKDITDFALTILDDANAAAVKSTLGLGSMADETSGDYLTVADAATDYLAVSDNLASVASASTARTNLGVAIGSNVQAYGDVLDDLNTLGAPISDGQFIVATGSGAFAYESGSVARSSLDLKGNEPLAFISGANFNITTDQTITMPTGSYTIDCIVVTNASISLSTAAGGIYTGASKSGTDIVANTQAYSALTTSSKYIEATLEAETGTDTFSGNLFLSLTTAQGAAATADVYIYGKRLR